MAEVVAISLKVDSGQSVQEVQKLEDAIRDVQKTTNSSNVEEKFNALNMSIEQGAGSVEDLRKAIKSYQTIALSAGRTSPIGKEALNRSAQLKDKLTDLDNEVKRLSQDGKNLQGALQIGGGVVAGYQAFTSLTALLGVENEELMKTMVKLQASMSLLQAIEQIRLATEKESLATMFISNVRTKVAIGLKKAYAFAVGGGTKAMKLFRGALISTGLGALVVLLGTIIAKWDDWKDSIISFIKGAFSPLIDALQYLGIIESDLEKERRTNHENEMQRIQERRDALGSVRDKAEQDLKNEIAIANARGENTDKSQKKLLKLTRDNAQKRIDDNNALIEEIESGNRVATEEEYKNTQDSIIADRKLREGAEQDLKVFDATKSKERRDRGRKADEEELDRLREQMQKEIDLQTELEDAIIQGIEDEDARKLAQMQIQHEREITAIQDKYGFDTELEAQLLRNQAEALNEVKREIAQKEFDEEKDLLDFADAEDDKRQKANVDKSLANQDKELKGYEATEKAKQQLRLDGLDATAGVISGLATLFDKNEKVQKASALAQIGIDTAKAISSLVANSEGNPLNLVTGGVAGIVQFASGMGRILANIGQAKKLLQGGSGVSVPSTSRASTTVSRTETNASNTNTGNTDFQNNGAGKVFLVTSELQAMQSRDREVQRVATI